MGAWPLVLVAGLCGLGTVIALVALYGLAVRPRHEGPTAPSAPGTVAAVAEPW
ncbi:hypothetical protein [Streptomyces oceani]|uniref:hypothetical protein n=1 Tax=Streptomyces oceani TaxID=1075402 RepID=UPI001480BBB9|nr:hypothetical protein [Streptomyces oceani]